MGVMVQNKVAHFYGPWCTAMLKFHQRYAMLSNFTQNSVENIWQNCYSFPDEVI